MKSIRIFSVLLLLLFSFGCSSSKRPILYPNNHFNTVGNAHAQADIDECMRLAHASGADAGKGEEVAKDAAKAGAVGAATGAVVGAISSSSDIGRGAAIGGAGAATARLVGGAFDASEPTPIFMRFVDRCLADKGYQTLGWR